MRATLVRTLRSLAARLTERPEYRPDLALQERPAGKTLVVGIGAGRSGKRWLSEIFDRHANAAGLPEPHPVREAFFLYCNWYRLPVDHAGLFHLLLADINKLFRDHEVVYLASPWLSLGLEDVERYLRPDAYFFSVRDPEAVVRSMVGKGWFSEQLIRGDAGRAPGTQPYLRAVHHQFSRIVPVGQEGAGWENLTPVGRCAWYWSAINRRISTELESVHAERVFRLRLEDIDQNQTFYRNVAARFGLGPRLTPRQFQSIKAQMPNIGRQKTQLQWSTVETAEFEEHVAGFDRVYRQLKTAFQ